jgi:hypothetical protein
MRVELLRVVSLPSEDVKLVVVLQQEESYHHVLNIHCSSGSNLPRNVWRKVE